MRPRFGSQCSSVGGRSGRKFARPSLIVIALIVVSLGLATSKSILRCVAHWWVVSDRLEPVDGIVILGGGVDVRPAAAADLYSRGFAPLILVGTSRFDHGLNAALNRQKLLQAGVPASAIIEFSFQPHNTYGEARGILHWAQQSGAKSFIIPIDVFQTRRVRWIFNHELGPARMQTIIYPVTPRTYDLNDWWLHKDGIANFRRELIKFVYYRLRY